MTEASLAGTAPDAPTRYRSARTCVTILAQWSILPGAAAVIAWSVRWGRHVQRDPRVKLGAAPFVGAWHLRLHLAILPAVVLATVVALVGPAVARRLRFGALVAVTAAATAAYTLALAFGDGPARVLDPVVHPTEYWANLATLPPAATMVHRYASIPFLLSYSVHAKGHPPGFLLLLKGLSAVRLGHPWTVAAVSYVGAALTAAGVLGTVRAVAGAESARAVAPFLVLAPYAVWMGTSADAFYAGVGALGVYLVARALVDDRPTARLVAGATGGLTLGLLLFLTYAGAVFVLLPVAVLVGLTVSRRWWRRGIEVAVTAALGGAAVLGVFRLAGFWWFDGLRTTKTLYWWGTAQFRPPYYFALAGAAVTLAVIGPATLVGGTRLRSGALWLIVGAAVACLAIADASQYSKGEVERIWLLFFPWLIPAAARLCRSRRWLAAQAAVGVGLQMALVSKW